MRVVIPEIEDTSEVSPHVIRECGDKKIYKLEPFVNGVFKRSVDLHQEAKFAEFFGRNIIEYNFLNLNEVVDYEKNNN
jgi:integral membrane protein 2B